MKELEERITLTKLELCTALFMASIDMADYMNATKEAKEAILQKVFVDCVETVVHEEFLEVVESQIETVITLYRELVRTN